MYVMMTVMCDFCSEVSNMILIIHQNLQHVKGTIHKAREPPQKVFEDRAALKTYIFEAIIITVKKTI